MKYHKPRFKLANIIGVFGRQRSGLSAQRKGGQVIVENSSYWILVKKLYIYVLEKGSSFWNNNNESYRSFSPCIDWRWVNHHFSTVLHVQCLPKTMSCMTDHRDTDNVLRNYYWTPHYKWIHCENKEWFGLVKWPKVYLSQVEIKFRLNLGWFSFVS